MTIKLNPDVGPRWFCETPTGSRTAAHSRSDAEAFEKGEITLKDVEHRNMKIENAWDMEVYYSQNS